MARKKVKVEPGEAAVPFDASELIVVVGVQGTVIIARGLHQVELLDWKEVEFVISALAKQRELQSSGKLKR